MKFKLFNKEPKQVEDGLDLDDNNLLSLEDDNETEANQTESYKSNRKTFWSKLSRVFEPIDEIISKIIPNENLAVVVKAAEVYELKKNEENFEELPHTNAILLNPTICAMAKRKYFSHTFELPTKSLNEARRMIMLQLEQVVPFPLQTAILDVVKLEGGNGDTGLNSFTAFVTREKDIAHCRNQIENNREIEVFVATHLVQGVQTWGVFRDRNAKRARAERRMPIYFGIMALALSSLLLAGATYNRQVKNEILLVSATSKAKNSLVNLRRELQSENSKLGQATKGAMEFGPDRALVGLSEASLRLSNDVKVQLIEIKNGKVRIVAHSPNPEVSKQSILTGKQTSSNPSIQPQFQPAAPQINSQNPTPTTSQYPAETNALKTVTLLPFDVIFEIPTLRPSEAPNPNSGTNGIGIIDNIPPPLQKPQSFLARLFGGSKQ